MTTLRATAVLLSLAAGALLAPVALAEEPEKVSVDVAVNTGLVDVRVTSLGGAVGNTLKVTVQSKVQKELQLVLPAGMVFVAASSKVQSLTATAIKGEMITAQTYRPASVMVLVDTQPHTFLLETCCMDYHKAAPKAGQQYVPAPPDPRAARIVTGPKDPAASVWAYQCALWMDRAGVSAAELKRRFHVADVDIRVAQSLLEHSTQVAVTSIPGNVSVDVRVQLEGIYSPDPAVRAQAYQALRAMGDKAAEAMAMAQANMPPPVAPPGTTPEAANTYESLIPPEYRGFIPTSPEDMPEAAARIREMLSQLPGPPVAVPAVPGSWVVDPVLETALAFVNHPLPAFRERAAWRLGTIKSPRAVDGLIVLLGDPDPTVRDTAVKGLKSLTGQDLGTERKAWQEWWDKNRATLFAPPQPPAQPPPATPAPTPPAAFQ